MVSRQLIVKKPLELRWLEQRGWIDYPSRRMFREKCGGHTGALSDRYAYTLFPKGSDSGKGFSPVPISDEDFTIH